MLIAIKQIVNNTVGNFLNMGGDVTKMQMVGVTFLWKIEKYSTIPSDQWFKSSIFNLSGLGYYLDLLKNNCYFEIRLHRNGSTSESSKFRFIIGLVDKKGHEQFTKATEITLDKEIDTVTLLKLEETSLQMGLVKEFLTGDTLTISLNACILNEAGNDIFFRGNSNMHFESLSADFGKYLESQFNSDVLLKAGDVSFPVHRHILSARSPVFKAMFQHETSEKHKGVVNIIDIQPGILEDLLHYMYTGKIRGLTAEIANQMYSAADKYNLLELKEECRKYVISSLSTRNISAAAKLSETYNELSIRDAVIQLVSEKKDEILKDELWKLFVEENSLFASSILSAALISGKK